MVGGGGTGKGEGGEIGGGKGWRGGVREGKGRFFRAKERKSEGGKGRGGGI